MSSIKTVPLWQKNFRLYVKSYPILQVTGNIEDLVPYRGVLGTGMRYLDLKEWIFNILSQDPNNLVIFYSLFDRYKNPYSRDHESEFTQIAGRGGDGGFYSDVRKIHHAMDNGNGKKLVVICDQSLRCLTAGPMIQPEDQMAFTELKFLFGRMQSYGNIIFISEKPSDIPVFMMETQSFSKSIIIPKPDQVIRVDFLQYLFSNRDFSDSQMLGVAQRAENLTLIEIRTALSDVDYANCPCGDLSKKLSLFQLGFHDDPWSQVDGDKIEHAETELGNYVFGQDEAVAHAAKIVRFAASGFGNILQDDGRTAPKGVMFFSGLSGTGKTELAKAIARLVFGSADSMIRFDMGEYGEPHSAERLTGSPPGYIGHDAGGQLTEAIKAHPFSVILFDEIEKAHPAIMNKFLAIIDDGRLTDGKGETVSFENTIIIFTSNLGAAEASAEADPERIHDIIFHAVRDYCEKPLPEGIGHPELYSRLAGSIVIFKPLCDEAIDQIFHNYYKNIGSRLEENLGIKLVLEEGFISGLKDIINIQGQDNQYPGGRGMKKAMEQFFSHPLSIFLKDHKCKAGDVITLKRCSLDGEHAIFDANIKKGLKLEKKPEPVEGPEPVQTNSVPGFRIVGRP